MSLLWVFLCISAALQSSAAQESQAPAPAPPEAPAAEKPAEKPTESTLDAPGPDAEFVGSSFCNAPACHASLVSESHALRHSHYVSNPKYKEAAGCEICHGPASNHVADPEHRHMYRFTVQSPENARRINEACMKCHQETVSRPHFQATEHARVGLSCANCHEMHYDLKTPYLLRFPGVGGPAGQPRKLHKQQPEKQAEAPPAADAAGAEAQAEEVNLPQLMALAKTRVPIPNWRTSFTREPTAVTEEQTVGELCASCHRRQVTELRQFSHHPLFEGRIKCTDCHDAHRAEQGQMLRRRTVEETCLQCHQHVRGPFVFEHEPVKSGGVGEACLECHRPHGSPNRSLLTVFSRGLCAQCHADIQQDPAHRGRRGDCWRSNCHVAIHGSNHSPFFFRE